jgi:NhaP-type Na+/H+ or K+/H+ antiporter
MELLIMVLMLLMLIGASNVLNRCIPFVPVPIIQIALGVAAAYMPGLHHVPLDPELFLVLFIAPLLFNDGKVIDDALRGARR